MKLFRTIGLMAIALLFISAFLPWAHVQTDQGSAVTFTGLHAGTNGLWKPALIAMIFSLLYLLTMFIAKIWVKIAGVFFGVIVLAWTVSVYYRLRGNALEPHTFQFGIYLFVLAAVGIMASALFPYVPDKARKKTN